MIADAKALEAAGAQLLVLECIPASLGEAITQALTIPTIGIGQVKILTDKFWLCTMP